MKAKRFFHVFVVSIFFGTHLFAQSFTENKELPPLFEKHNLTGTFVLYNAQTNAMQGYNKKRSNTRFYPASTFKIYNSLIGLHTRAVQNVDEVFYFYKGEDVYLESWAKDSNLRYGMKESQVPAYQLLAQKIGLEAMQEQVNVLNIGNKKVGNNVREFYLQGPLQVSA
ncbi:MAG: penicillin-binding transpeptidase domain-containing protein, partial [Treponemataceae bacterium]